MSSGVVNPLFASVKLNADGLKAANRIEAEFTKLFIELSDILPCGREFSLVQTKLQEASMFAKKVLSLQERYTVLVPAPKGYVVEVEVLGCGGKWVRSINHGLTVHDNLSRYVFNTLEAAELEVKAQNRGSDMYRAAPLA